MEIPPFAKELLNSFYHYIIRHRFAVKCVAALIIALSVSLLYNFDTLRRIELGTFDYRFGMRHAKPIDQRIVFIDMAEDSIEAIGRWPWPRKWHATLTKILAEYSPKAVVFDVIFSEPQDEIDDAAFAEAIKRAGMVYLPLSYNLAGVYDQKLGYKIERPVSIVLPIESYRNSIKGTGHISIFADPDGIMRRVPPIIRFKDISTYQLGLKIGCDVLGVPADGVKFDVGKHEIALTLPDRTLRRVPLDDDNQLVVNWRARWGKETTHHSYIDIIRSYALMKEGKPPIVDLEKLRGKICIVGLTALGLTDIKPIPIENAYPAVGANAMVINSVLDNDFVRVTHQKVDVVLIFLISFIFTLCLSELRPLFGMTVAAASIAAYLAISVMVFKIFNIMIVTFYPILAIFIAYVITAAYTQILQSMERARLFRQATRDGLTGLYNVRHFNLLFEAELRNVTLDKTRRMSAMMFDIDNFKKLNDTYGHQAGDLILKEFAKIMQSKCRQTDVVARYGGEEFIIMLIGAGQKEASDVAEKIRVAIEQRKFKFGNDTYSTAVSIGITEFNGEKTREEFVEKADKALYHSKHTGKNRFTVYTPELETAPTAKPR